MVHDFKKFPELTNSQMELYYFQSPHKQIVEDFRADVVKVTDGDTITVRTTFRDFDFPVRFLNNNAPELNENGGKESKSWLEGLILGKEVDILIDPNQRVGKFGRILGTIMHRGIELNEQSIREGFATTFENRREGQLPTIERALKT
jgi:endonuclease YncB( thermonuclease family)